jgi:hypothetical protein
MDKTECHYCKRNLRDDEKVQCMRCSKMFCDPREMGTTCGFNLKSKKYFGCRDCYCKCIVCGEYCIRKDMNTCKKCKKYFCPDDCGKEECSVCDGSICNICGVTTIGKNGYCHKCYEKCNICSELSKKSKHELAQCVYCNNYVCGNCYETCSECEAKKSEEDNRICGDSELEIAMVCKECVDERFGFGLKVTCGEHC